MSLKNIVYICNSIIRNEPHKFYKVKPYLKTLSMDIEKYKPLFKKENSYKDYSRLQIGGKYENDKFNYSLELYLLKWSFHSMSKIHNHTKYGCCMKVVEGKLLEDVYDKNIKLTNHNLYKKNDTSFINDDKGYHQMFNYHYSDSYSLHLYCDILDKPTEIKYFGA